METVDTGLNAPTTATLGDVMRDVTRRFRERGIDTPGLDARLLIAAAAEISPSRIVTTPEIVLTAPVIERIGQCARRRLSGEPVSRILGHRAFHGLVLEIGPATLDPRADTETLVEGALLLIKEGRVPGGETPRILDLGTGSGAILLSLLAALPGATGIATDISADALTIAERNAVRAGVRERVTFLQTNWFDAIDGHFDLVLSNPPYIASGEIAGLATEVRDHDPKSALDGGTDGLDAYRIIVDHTPSVLRPGGWLLLEVGDMQHGDVAELCARRGAYHAADMRQVWWDLGGRMRCVAVQSHIS